MTQSTFVFAGNTSPQQQFLTMETHGKTLRTKLIIDNGGSEALAMIPSNVVLRDYNSALFVAADAMHPLEAIEIGYKMTQEDFNVAVKYISENISSDKERTYKLFDLQMIKNS